MAAINRALILFYKAAATLVFACSFGTILNAAAAGIADDAAEKRMALVGKTSIAPNDVDYRLGVEGVYGNEKATVPAAFVSIVNDAIEQEVAAAHGVDASGEEIKTFKKYVDENTKAPDLLAKVKAVFKGDERSYERIYLSPKIVNRKLHYFYSRDPGIHKSERITIERAYSLVVSGRIALKDAASELGLEYTTFSIGDKKEETTPALSKYMSQNDAGDDPITGIVEKLTLGQVYDHVVEDDNGYQVIRLLEKDGKKYSVESIRAKKRPFDEWFREEGRKMRIEILDPALKKEILTAYPVLWWLKGIR